MGRVKFIRAGEHECRFEEFELEYETETYGGCGCCSGTSVHMYLNHRHPNRKTLHWKETGKFSIGQLNDYNVPCHVTMWDGQNLADIVKEIKGHKCVCIVEVIK